MSATTPSTERSFAAILATIVRDLQEIMRSEVKLATTEVRERAAEWMQGISWLATGVLSAFFAVAFLLVAAFFALSRLMPLWASALVIAGALIVVSGVTFAVRASIVKTNLKRHEAESRSASWEGVA